MVPNFEIINKLNPQTKITSRKVPNEGGTDKIGKVLRKHKIIPVSKSFSIKVFTVFLAHVVHCILVAQSKRVFMNSTSS